VLGTARYASPEQAQGRALTGHSDIYSLALVLIEAVTGEVPFSVDTTLGTLMARTTEPIPVSDRLGVLRPILRAAGAVDPDDRPDAARLAGRLVKATEELDPPDPLPLAGAIVLPDVEIDLGRDPTLLPGELELEEDDQPPVFVPEIRPTRRQRRRERREAKRAARGEGAGRRRLLVGVLSVVGLLLVAGGAYGAYVMTRPEHPVPELAGGSVSQVGPAVRDLNFDVQRIGERGRGRPGQVVAQDPDPGTKLREGQTFTVTVSRGPDFVPVPERLLNLTAAQPLSREDAQALLEEAGFVVGYVSEKFNEQVVAGTVQAVALPFDQLPRGSAVDLVVSKGPRPRIVPEDLVGRPYDEVAAELESLSLVVNRVEEANPDEDEGTVLRVDPVGGTQVERDSTVTVVVAIPKVEVPDVSGMSIQAAYDELTAAGLEVDRVQGPPVGEVTSTDPEAGSLVDPGSSVTLITSRGGGGNNDEN
jgi:serine/threonine-protein kinase